MPEDDVYLACCQRRPRPEWVMRAEKQVKNALTEQFGVESSRDFCRG